MAKERALQKAASRRHNGRGRDTYFRRCIRKMEIAFVEFNPDEKKFLTKEVRQAAGDGRANVTCRISRDSSGRGIGIDLQGTARPAPLILLPDGEWQTERMVGGRICDALADADNPSRVERALCEPLN
jgi:hypothetical protein